MDTTEERMSNRSEVEGMDMIGNCMMEDTMMDSVQVERVHKGVVMVKHRSDNGVDVTP
jgi:hypothetical protein